MKTSNHPTHLPIPITKPSAPFARSRPWRIVLPSLRLSVSERKIMLAIVDAALLNVALLVILVERQGFPLSWASVTQAPHYYLLLTGLWWAWASFLDCYELARTANASQSAWRAGGAALLTAVTYLTIPYITPDLLSSRLSSFLFLGSSIISVPTWRLFYATVFVQPTFQQRVLIVGADPSGAEMARELARTPQEGNPYAGSGYHLVGFFDHEKAGTNLEGVPVLGHRDNLQEMVQELDIDILVVATSYPQRLHRNLFQTLLDCRELGVGIEPVTSLYERVTGKVPVEHAGSDLSVVMPASDSPAQRLFSMGKRLMDIAGGLAGLVVLLPVAGLVALINAIWNPGPLFYQQVRVGKGGKPFRVIKFRSMIPNAEEDCGAVWAQYDDDRITPVGKLLRRTRLDELPQVLNVLRGEMSLVGPRPERPEFVTDLVKEVPYFQARHAVRPGITGWAQVRYRYGSSVEDALVKLQHDLYYVKHQSLFLELSILVKTAAVMLGLKGR